MKDEVILVKGMHCGSCVKLIESKLSRLKGVESVVVSLPEETARVTYDPDHISIADLEQEIRDLGYRAGPDDQSSSRPSTPSSGRGKTVLQAITYGLVPHIGCIGFIIATVLGVTVATEFFKPLLLNPYFFYIMIGISFVFATVSSLVYLKRQGFITLGNSDGQLEVNISRNTLQRKWKYLATMYGSTIAINLLLFFLVFPAVANLSFSQPAAGLPIIGNVGAAGASLSPGTGAGLASIRLQVKIPCSGHAALITGELKKLPGVKSATFAGSNTFDVTYDPDVTPKAAILGLDVFKTYAATVLSESSASSAGTAASAGTAPKSGGGCGCGGCGG